jgi:hypothetical protein
MDREQEHIALKQELESTPPTLDDVFLKAQSRKRKRIIRKAIITPLGSCAAVFILFVGLVNFSPAIAAAAEQIPGLQRLLEFVSFSPSLTELVEQGYVQTVGLEQRVGDSTLRVEHIIKEGKQLHVFMTLDPSAYDHMSISASASGATSISITFRRMQYDAIEFHELIQITLGFDTAVPSVVHLSGDVIDFSNNTDGNSTGRSSGRYSFTIYTD